MFHPTPDNKFKLNGPRNFQIAFSSNKVNAALVTLYNDKQ